MLRSVVSFLLTACLCLPTPIASESRGAPTCVTGAAPGQPHTDERYLQLLIDEFSFIEILVDSPRFGVAPVKLGRTVYVPVNQTITVTVTKADRPYRGIMTRIGGGSADADTATAFILNDDEVELKYNQYCDLDVGGITHTSPEPKTTQSWTMYFDTPSQDMRWDMNIVETRRPSRFYYSYFNVTVLADDETPPPTPPPTPSPTASPTISVSAANTVSFAKAAVTALVVLGVALAL